MIRHIVMWTLTEKNDVAAFEDNKLALREMLLQLKQAIPGVLALDVKFNINPDAINNYDICLICDFATYSDLNKYQEHTEHQKVIKFLKSIRLNRACIDIEFK